MTTVRRVWAWFFPAERDPLVSCLHRMHEREHDAFARGREQGYREGYFAKLNDQYGHIVKAEVK